MINIIKKISIIIVVIVVFIAGYIGYKFSLRHDGFNIEIKNNLDESVSGLTITYQGITEDIKLPTIKRGETYKVNVTPKEDFSESQMIIYYKDKRNVIQKNILIGYFEKGYWGEVKVTIYSQNNNGVLFMKIEEKI